MLGYDIIKKFLGGEDDNINGLVIHADCEDVLKYIPVAFLFRVSTW
jgi:hypothetical protein